MQRLSIASLALTLVSCVPSPPAVETPASAGPAFSHSGRLKVEPRSNPWDPVRFVYSDGRGGELRSTYPASAEVMNRLLSGSNFDFSKRHLEAATAIAFGGGQSPAPAGDRFSLAGDKRAASLRTVGPRGSLYLVRVSLRADGSYDYRAIQKSRHGFYPHLIRIGGAAPP